MPEGDSTTAAPSQSLRCPATPGYSSTRSHREQQRMPLTNQVAPPEGNSGPAWQHKTTAGTGDLAQQESCGTEPSAPLSRPTKFWRRSVDAPKAPPRQQPLAGLWAESDRLCTTALGSATLAASKMPSQQGGHRPLLFQICVFPACNEIPARVHNGVLRPSICRPGTIRHFCGLQGSNK